MKKMTLNILLFVLLMTAAIVSASWVGICASSGISYNAYDPNEPGPESTNSLISYLAEDTNEPGPEFVGGLTDCLTVDPNEPGPEYT